mmetsp:Transcript_34394/g.88985  ORF Transcript_34394/g.88985 Transcript_34394/m.88985 type:complete len:208 (+) Transcript_34394:2128-2751(+)
MGGTAFRPLCRCAALFAALLHARTALVTALPFHCPFFHFRQQYLYLVCCPLSPVLASLEKAGGEKDAGQHFCALPAIPLEGPSSFREIHPCVAERPLRYAAWQGPLQPHARLYTAPRKGAVGHETRPAWHHNDRTQLKRPFLSHLHLYFCGVCHTRTCLSNSFLFRDDLASSFREYLYTSLLVLLFALLSTSPSLLSPPPRPPRRAV